MAGPRFQFVCSYAGKTLTLSRALSHSDADGDDDAGSKSDTAYKSDAAIKDAGFKSETGQKPQSEGQTGRAHTGHGHGDGRGYDHVAWRLLGANNRELGRSPVWYPDIESCREAVRALKREIGGVTPAIMSVALPGGAWSWRLAVSGTPVAVAGRHYHRQRECAYNLSHFVAAVPDALIADEHCIAGRR